LGGPEKVAVNSDSQGYAGDVDPKEAWEALRNNEKAVLVDVRTQPEWVFVGVPDLRAAGKQPLLVQWQVFPSMQKNPNFIGDLRKAGVTEDAPVYFICRSGGRSRAAAIAATEAGFAACYNVAGGFEGNLDSERHRGHKEGWKADGLPWLQD
jgi:rhodanese-related sulfurtransferase